MTATSKCATVALASLALLTPSTSAQAPILVYRVPDAQSGPSLFRSLQSLGDVDGDGVGDLAIAFPGDTGPHGEPKLGSVRVHSGLDGKLVWSASGAARLDRFGTGLGVLEDLDGDGIAELLVGAPGRDGAFVDEGEVVVLSGATGVPLLKIAGSGTEGTFGSAVAGIGDQDGDGVDDVAVGTPFFANLKGRVQVFSGASGQLLTTLVGQTEGDHFGAVVERLGDVDLDGTPDYLIASTLASYTFSSAGRVELVSGASATVIRTHDGAEELLWLGLQMRGLGDVDGDGVADYAIGTEGFGPKRGRVRAYSGRSGAVLWTAPGPKAGTMFGRQICTTDHDGDGVLDVVATTGASKGLGDVRVLSGVDGSLLRAYDSGWGATVFGHATVEGIGDVNGDGFGDFAVRTTDTLSDSSHAFLFLLAGRGPVGASYCGPAQPNSTGQPGELSAQGSPDATVDDLVLTATSLPASQSTWVVASRTQGFVSGVAGSQGDLCLGGAVRRLNSLVGESNGAGSFEVAVPLGVVPAVAGETWNFQVWYRDVNPTSTSNLTDGLTLTLR